MIKYMKLIIENYIYIESTYFSYLMNLMNEVAKISGSLLYNQLFSYSNLKMGYILKKLELYLVAINYFYSVIENEK